MLVLGERMPYATDIFVIGGGPAGLATAIAARERGFRVVVADGMTPPIDKACGEGLLPETLAALRELGVEVGSTDGAPFRGIAFSQPDARAEGDFPHGRALGVRRSILHRRMLERAEVCGAKLLWQAPVAAIEGHSVRLASGHTIAARWIVGADGQQSRVRDWLGVQTAQLQRRFAARRHYRVAPWSDRVEVHWSNGVQAYVTPVGPEEVGVALLASSPDEANFDRAFTKFPLIAERVSGAEITSRERGSVTAMRTLHAVHRGHVALVGDASGGVDAITGEGIRLGIRQASLLVKAISQNNLAHYERDHRRLAAQPRLIGHLLLFLDRHPAVRERAVRALARRSDLFSRMLAIHTGNGTRASALTAGAALAWRSLLA
jgi:menaquinone-9 beta-reductase